MQVWQVVFVVQVVHPVGQVVQTVALTSEKVPLPQGVQASVFPAEKVMAAHSLHELLEAV